MEETLLFIYTTEKYADIATHRPSLTSRPSKYDAY